MKVSPAPTVYRRLARTFPISNSTRLGSNCALIEHQTVVADNKIDIHTCYVVVT